MKKIAPFLLAVLLLPLLTLSVAFAIVEDSSSIAAPSSKEQTPDWANLTESQKKEIYDLQGKILELRKQMIDKYQSFGILTKERAEEIKQKMDEKFKIMKEKGFIPRTHHHKGEWKKKHR
ncbi:MAG: YckD family protein [Clostridia bacterium]|jgi:uncharacterized lipoprotein YehR (DUF1307 family)